MKSSAFILKPLVVSLLILSSCGKGDIEPSAEEKPVNMEVTETQDLTPAVANGAATTYEWSKNKGEDKEQDEKKASEEQTNEPVALNAAVKIPEKIKKTADINITVDDYKMARAAIAKIVNSGHAYISGENEQNNTYSISNSMIIRVANKDFDAMVNNVTGITGHVNSKNIYTEDVTAQFVDLTARLKSKKEVEKRYTELLQRAVKVDDVLEVEEQLRVIREEIEAKEGELKYLNDQVDYSTINLNFHQDFEFTPQDRPGFFGRVGSAFGNGWNGFLSFLVSIVYAWPLLLILSAGGYFLYRFIKRMMKRK